MSTKQDILNILSDNIGAFVSGQEIAEKLNVSRNAIWKAIEKLKEDGLPVESKARSGYCLKKAFDFLSEETISNGLNFDCDLLVKDSVDSTNALAKKQFKDKKLLVVSNEQSKGRGRLGRDFFSPAGTGIYMSYAFKPAFSITEGSLVTLAAAVAVAQAMEKVCKKSPKVKWVNDLFLNDKKIGGILTEASMNLEGGHFDSLIIGIGLNCFTKDFPEMERNIPGSIETDASYTRNELIYEIANNLNKWLSDLNAKDLIFEYKTRCNTLGKAITIFRDYNNPNEVGQKARAYDIDENGGLIVEFSSDLTGQFHTITSGEITIRE